MESTIELSVFKKEIHFIKKDILTTGQQRNSMKITFNGKEWDKLTKFGVFKVENVVRQKGRNNCQNECSDSAGNDVLSLNLSPYNSDIILPDALMSADDAMFKLYCSQGRPTQPHV